MDLVPVLAGIGGIILLWSALKNKHPMDVIQFSLQGLPLDGARPLSPDIGGLLGAIIPGSYDPTTAGQAPGTMPNNANEGGGMSI
jgi:hypothetical protein